MNQQEFSAVTPEFERLAKLCESHDVIDPELYTKYQVKRGLRDLDGKGVLTGLTEISTIISSVEVNGVTIPIDGQLYYRGINIYSHSVLTIQTPWMSAFRTSFVRALS